MPKATYDNTKRRLRKFVVPEPHQNSQISENPKARGLTTLSQGAKIPAKAAKP